MPVGAMSKEISGLKREIKRAKLFEVQRLVRRIRQLAYKKGTETQIKKNQRKIERFEKELEFLKDAEVDEIAVRINRNESGDRHMHENVAYDVDLFEDQHGDIDLQKRALNRIINSGKLQKFVQRIETNNQDSVGSEKESSDSDMPRLKPQQKIAKRNLKTVDNPAASGRRQIKDEIQDGESSGFNKGTLRLKEHRKNLKLDSRGTAAVSINPELEIDYEHESSSEEECSKSKKKKTSMMVDIPGSGELLTEDDDGFLASSDLNESDFEEESDDLALPEELKPKGLESCFVQTLSGLKERSGTKARNKQGKEKGKPSNNKGKKNRKGQRARQQMWKKVHGRGAKHLQKNKTRSEPREGKEHQKQMRKIQTQHSFKPKSVDESLHPSWEAMRKKRSQETLKVEFKGQKIKFDDSD